MLQIPHDITPSQAFDALDCALALGFGCENATFPVAGFDGDVLITRPDSLWQTSAIHHPSPVTAPQGQNLLYHSDTRSTRGLEDLFSAGLFLQDDDNDYLPDRTNVRIRLPQNPDSHTVTAACNIAFRLGMETTATKGTIVARSGWNGNTIAFVPSQETKMTMEKSGDTATVYIHGSGEKLIKFTSLICNSFPKTDCFHTWGDTLCRITQDLAMQDTDGQFAHLKALMDTSADQSGFALFASPVDATCPALPHSLSVAQIYSHKAEKTVYTQDFDIPWEVDTLNCILEQQLYPHIKSGDTVNINCAVSEGTQVRTRLENEIARRITSMGAHCTITLVNSYKQGYSWICEKVVPGLSRDTDRVEIRFRPFLPAGQTDWLDENGAAPKRTVDLEDTPDKWFDLPIRYLQELYPVEDFIVQHLGIPKENIVFLPYQGDEDITYHITAFCGDTALSQHKWKAHTGERPYLDRFPQLGRVHPSTGFVNCTVNGNTVLDTTFKTDLENVWDIYQQQVLPRCLDHVISTPDGFDVTKQPFFGTLHLDITLSEEEKSTGSRQDIISPLSALHEDLYFTGSDFFKYCGLEMCSKAADAPGLILPQLHIGEGKPRFCVTLTQPLCHTPCITHHGKTVRLPATTDSISAAVTQLALRGDSLEVTVDIQGVPADVVKSYAALWDSADLDISRQTGGFSQLVFRTAEGSFTAGCHATAPQKGVDIRDIDIMEKSVIGYDDYIGIINQLKQVDGLQVFPVAKSFMGRTIYAVWVCPHTKGCRSMTKYLTRRSSIVINTRHHANEVSGTNSAFMLIKKLLCDPQYKNITDRVNILFVPVENVDGTAIHFDLQKEHPTWQLHTARFNAIGKEFAGEYFAANPLSREATAMGALYEKFVPDIVTDNHGVPSHEWDQQFSGYTSPAYKGFWLPRSLLYGYFWYISDKEYAPNISVNKRMEAVIANIIAQDEQMTQLNREWTHQFCKYANSWMPKLFPAEYYGDMINYWIGYQYNPKHMYAAIRYPWLTAVSYTSEVADETAQGDYLYLCAKAHLAHDEATLQMMTDATNCFDSIKTVTTDGVQMCHRRQRPMIV
ncbi:MAG: hypothetical protein IIV99_05580 [Oscillospiraceae bacterium]|nr:hypothetical protein [Oscillospiraceae bacterium]